MKATPKGGSDAEDRAGAYVNCWINFQLEDGANQLANFYLEQAGWRIDATEESKWVEREYYDSNPDGLQYFTEAETDGASFVVNTWPTNGEDEDS